MLIKNAAKMFRPVMGVTATQIMIAVMKMAIIMMRGNDVWTVNDT